MRDLVGGKDAVVIRIQRGQQGRNKWRPCSRRTGGAWTIGASAGSAGTTWTIWTIWTIWTAWASRAIGPRTTGTAGTTLRPWRPQFIGSELTVLIKVQGGESGRGIGDLGGVDLAVLVRIESGHQWRRPMPGAGAGSARRRAAAGVLGH